MVTGGGLVSARVAGKNGCKSKKEKSQKENKNNQSFKIQTNKVK
jgi:hypothetical protein